MEYQEQLNTILQESQSRTSEIIDNFRQRNPLKYPSNFQSRVSVMKNLKNGQTICWQTALYLLGIVDQPLIQTNHAIQEFDNTAIAEYLLSERTHFQIADKSLLALLNSESSQPDAATSLFKDCPLIMMKGKQAKSAHWMVNDPLVTSMIFQTDDHNQPFRHIHIKDLFDTGNFGMQDSVLKDPRGLLVFHFIK